MKRWLILIAFLAAAGAAAWFLTRGDGGGGETYRLVEVARGDVEEVVTSTGTLDAVTKVQVGTQVSGLIATIGADFNDRVTAGQVIAVIDTTLLASEVRSARASVARAEAERNDAQRELARTQELFREQLVSQTDLDKALYAAESSAASLVSARVGLDRASNNLKYATIRAPISGTVVERNVDVGQTVAANFSAPQLFLIAEDLARMQILAAVDESDIGKIVEGQAARFTVQAHDDEQFQGSVRQVRLQSTVAENVVNYTVVIDVDNADGRLLPGMTATVDFVVSRAESVLTVPNAALRFKPTEAMVAALQARRAKMAAEGGRGAGAAGQAASGHGAGGQGAGMHGGGAGFAGGAKPTLLWYQDEDGTIGARPVRVGVSNGTVTEITAPWLQEGLQVVAGVTGGTVAATSTNPFQTQSTGMRPPPGGF
ncbi:MAG: efflux RND transporter periplasmic adaptor subunit [bacterium]|nr:efflux RND transporter periplasmic adaptor subunit [bacterium]MBK7703968.1 efflux RND transporter periplasmic adaptor subunit [bacterium]MBK9304924.1 efflux RND transporter periplasmic adaptor subunit [bacterium]